jgi:hypothetical protein
VVLGCGESANAEAGLRQYGVWGNYAVVSASRGGFIRAALGSVIPANHARISPRLT